jgi:tetratricopeptide (TPR) repeat protein
MYRMIPCIAAAVLMAVAVRPAAADDLSLCGQHAGDDSIAACTRLLAHNPREATVYVARGLAYKLKGEYDRAIADYDQALKLKPRDATVYNNRGSAWWKKQDFDRALADYDTSIRLDPKFASAYANRALVYNDKSEYDRAIADEDHAVQLGLNFASVYSARGYAYGRKGDYARAMADLNKGVALDPNYARGYSHRAAIHELHGDLDRAIADADEAVRLDPNDAFAYNWRGNAYFDRGGYDRAVADYEQAMRLNPAGTEARNGRDRARAALAARTPKPGDSSVMPSVAAAAPLARRALVIGIDAYSNLGAAAQLERAVADAEAVGDKLASLGFQVTRLTTQRQTSLETIIQGFDEFKKTVAKDDMVVLFYAGHGMALSDGTYLVPSDVRETSLQAEATARRVAISETELTDGLQRAGAGIVVAVIDACRNDLFSRATGRALGNGRGLRPAETEGIFKLYSASEGQIALDRLPGGDGSRNSVFTRVFLKAIDTPGLNLSALGTRVRDEVFRLARSADHAQTPAVYDKLIGSTEVYFAGEAGAERGAQ